MSLSPPADPALLPSGTSLGDVWVSSGLGAALPGAYDLVAGVLAELDPAFHAQVLAPRARQSFFPGGCLHELGCSASSAETISVSSSCFVAEVFAARGLCRLCAPPALLALYDEPALAASALARGLIFRQRLLWELCEARLDLAGFEALTGASISGLSGPSPIPAPPVSERTGLLCPVVDYASKLSALRLALFAHPGDLGSLLARELDLGRSRLAARVLTDPAGCASLLEILPVGLSCELARLDAAAPPLLAFVSCELLEDVRVGADPASQALWLLAPALSRAPEGDVVALPGRPEHFPWLPVASAPVGLDPLSLPGRSALALARELFLDSAPHSQAPREASVLWARALEVAVAAAAA